MAGPFVVPIADLRRRVGNRRALRRAVEVSAAEWPESVAGTTVPADGEIDLDVVLESVLDGVTVTGTLRAPWRADCRRCLEPVEGEIDVDVQELFEAHPTLGETYLLDGDHIDLEPLVRDAVLLALPLSALCAPDCAGPDPERFPAAVEPEPAEQADPAPPADPRWAVLRDVRFDE
jgi:DUF177 domain-containing protein